MDFKKRVRTIEYSMEFSHGIRRAIMYTLALVYFISLGFSVVSVTTLFAVSAIIMMFFEFPTGAIADYDSRKKSIMISFFLLFLGFLGLFLFTDFWLLAISWILTDVAWTFYTGAGGAWSIDALGIAKKKKELVNLTARSYVFEKAGHIIGGIIGFIVVAMSFRYVWLVVSLTNLSMFFIIWKYMEERNFTPEKVPHNYIKKSWIKAKESFTYILHQKNRELRALMIASFFGIFSISAFFVAVPLFLTQNLSLDPEYIPAIFAGITVVVMFAPFLAEKMFNKRGFRKTLFIAWILMGASMLLFGFPGVLILSIVSLLIIQFSEAINDVIEDSALHHEFYSKIRASLGSLKSMHWSISNALAVFLAGISITIFGIIPTIIISGCV